MSGVEDIAGAAARAAMRESVEDRLRAWKEKLAAVDVAIAALAVAVEAADAGVPEFQTIAERLARIEGLEPPVIFRMEQPLGEALHHAGFSTRTCRVGAVQSNLAVIARLLEEAR